MDTREDNLKTCGTESARWLFAYRPGPDAELLYRQPQEAMLAIWRNQIQAITSQHLSGSRPSLPNKVTTYMKEVARISGVVHGSWMVYEGRSRSSVDLESTWTTVKQAVLDGRLGAAKMTAGNPGSRVICVYSKSFTNVWDVWQVLEQLHSMQIYPALWEAEIVELLGLHDTNKVPRLDLVWFRPSELPQVCGFRAFACEQGLPSDYECTIYRESTDGPNINRHRHTQLSREPIMPMTLKRARNVVTVIDSDSDHDSDCEITGFSVVSPKPSEFPQ